MKRIRATVDAMLVNMLLRPMLRRAIARWRRGVRESAEARIVIPVQELLRTLMAAQLEPDAPSPLPGMAEVGTGAGRDLLRIALVLGAAAVLAAVAATAIVALRRRRRASMDIRSAGPRGPVVVPVEVPAEGTEATSASDRTPAVSG